MNMLVTVGKNWTIGNGGQRLVPIPEEQKLLREETLGKAVVMGRKAFEQLPGKQPLYGRDTFVLTRDPGFRPKGVTVCNSIEETLEKLKSYPTEDIYILGGESVFRQFLPFCHIIHVTFIDYAYQGDAVFENLDQSEQWQMVLESEEQTYFNLCYSFRMYQRKISE